MVPAERVENAACGQEALCEISEHVDVNPMLSLETLKQYIRISIMQVKCKLLTGARPLMVPSMVVGASSCACYIQKDPNQIESQLLRFSAKYVPDARSEFHRCPPLVSQRNSEPSSRSLDKSIPLSGPFHLIQIQNLVSSSISSAAWIYIVIGIIFALTVL
jgi:hypothetical protein